ncbi:MAG: hypothetical protein RBR45_14190 [Pseudomonas sp.]|nr:hypothetical protein [Pseudomonas sp.]
MKATTKNIKIAFALAQAAHLALNSQERVSTRTAVWVEDGEVFWSGQWTGQEPEGEIKTFQEMIDTWWKRRDPSFSDMAHPNSLFTIGCEPLNDQGNGWYPYTQVREVSPGLWMDIRSDYIIRSLLTIAFQINA